MKQKLWWLTFLMFMLSGQVWSVGSNIATAFRTYPSTPNSSHIHSTSTGKHPPHWHWVESHWSRLGQTLTAGCSESLWTDLCSTKPPPWRNSTNMSCWQNQTWGSPSTSSTRTPTELTPAVSHPGKARLVGLQTVMYIMWSFGFCRCSSVGSSGWKVTGRGHASTVQL